MREDPQTCLAAVVTLAEAPCTVVTPRKKIAAVVDLRCSPCYRLLIPEQARTVPRQAGSTAKPDRVETRDTTARGPAMRDQSRDLTLRPANIMFRPNQQNEEA
jgi:hypothetical protein